MQLFFCNIHYTIDIFHLSCIIPSCLTATLPLTTMKSSTPRYHCLYYFLKFPFTANTPLFIKIDQIHLSHDLIVSPKCPWTCKSDLILSILTSCDPFNYYWQHQQEEYNFVIFLLPKQYFINLIIIDF